LSENLTIAESKKEFHKSFSYVIPPIYRRLSDELLVELNLLSHQRDFKVDDLFSVGLNCLFKSFTVGYKPKEHVDELFNALCKSNGFDPLSIKNKASELIKLFEAISTLKTTNSENDGFEIDPKFLDNIKKLDVNKKYYSRIQVIGIIHLISNNNDIKISREKLKEISIKVSKLVDMPTERVDKDTQIYQSNLMKLDQAIELMEETITHDRKKREGGN
tara:strand:+ start:2399 stop:3052 length:654 start_codon:yes stop_codon:yes gene_type:complete